ncbi:hypothetical protein BH11PLA2_BH11PLA2_41620 [soil metagenome]
MARFADTAAEDDSTRRECADDVRDGQRGVLDDLWPGRVIGRQVFRGDTGPSPDRGAGTEPLPAVAVEWAQAREEITGEPRQPQVPHLRMNEPVKKPLAGHIRLDQWGGKKYCVFFLREAENGYCNCFRQPVQGCGGYCGQYDGHIRRRRLTQWVPHGFSKATKPVPGWYGRFLAYAAGPFERREVQTSHGLSEPRSSCGRRV